VFCSSARRRYGITVHCGHHDRAGHARITGRQNSIAVVNTHACST
jgi:hypothetical protein